VLDLWNLLSPEPLCPVLLHVSSVSKNSRLSLCPRVSGVVLTPIHKEGGVFDERK